MTLSNDKLGLSFLHSSSDFYRENCDLFYKISTQIAQLAATVDIKIVPFRNANLEHFSKLDFNSQKKILRSLEIYLNVYTAVQTEGSSLLDSVRVIWNALAQLGYRPTSDLFSYIEAGNVIEIHDSNLVQIFRNLVFFNYCSYSLEELYCYQMPELYSRDDISFEKNLMSYVQQIYNGSIKSVIKAELTPHTINELASADKLKITDEIHYIAPLFSVHGGSEAVATLTIESARIDQSLSHIIPADSSKAINHVLELTRQPSLQPLESST